MKHTAVVIFCAVLVLAGCRSGNKAKVSETELSAVRAAQTQLTVGASKQTTLAAFKYGKKTKLGSSKVDGVAIEEWNVEAFHDNDWAKRREMTLVYLYFLNDKLVESSDKRLNYRGTPALVEQWRSTAAK